jgi:hypothetical protein
MFRSGYKVKIKYLVTGPDDVFTYRTLDRARRKALSLGADAIIDQCYSYRYGCGTMQTWYVFPFHLGNNQQVTLRLVKGWGDKRTVRTWKRICREVK